MNVSSQTKFEIQLSRLYARINYELQDHVAPKSFDLTKMHGLVERLGSPELDYPIIHVAGTKGKGSVCTMLSSILTAAGMGTGVYTSPHLETFHQRMAVDRQIITDDQMLSVFERFEPVVSAYDQWLVSENRRPVTFFEYTTAMAMQFFSDQKCDAVVLETGMGGRLDSTNVCQPQVCIVTNISLDHTKQLGTSLEEIAFEKAGIIKPNVPVINGVVGAPCQRVIQDVAGQRNSALRQRDRDFSIRRHEDGTSFDFSMSTDAGQYRIENLQTAMLGGHQADNAALAIAAVVELSKFDAFKALRAPDESAASPVRSQVNEVAIRSGLANARLAGRLEQVSSNPTVILDMAHNPASVSALTDYLSDRCADWQRATERTLIFATTKDKDCEKMLALLMPLFNQVIFTRYQDNARALPTEDLVKASQRLPVTGNSIVIPKPAEAWARVFSESNDSSFICVAGSAFLLAELRSRIISDCKST